MTDEVDVPKVGPVDKRVVTAIVLGAGGFIAYRYWNASRASKSAAIDTAATDATGSEFSDSSGDPGTVLGAVRPNNDYGIPATDTSIDPASISDYGFRGTTNSAWTQYATAQLSQSDRWSYTDIVDALGVYLAQKPATQMQGSIISAAIAVAGHPPVGQYTLVMAPIPIAPVTPTPAKAATPAPVEVPKGLKVTAFTATTATIAWTPVTGASSYEVDIKPGALASTNGHEKKFMGLKGKSQYQFRVRAVSNNHFSQWSPYITVKTK